MLRLLQKRDIDSAKASDRAREIKEGLKLTQRIDGLRELATVEEQKLEEFKSSTLKSLYEKIEAKFKEDEALDLSILKKRKELEELSGPLDKAWLYYVKTEKESIDSLKISAEAYVIKNKDKSQELDERIAKAIEREQLCLEGQIRASEQYKKATRLVGESQELVTEAKSKASILTNKAEELEAAALRRDSQSKEREQTVLLKEESLKRKEEELEDREMKALALELLYYSPVKK